MFHPPVGAEQAQCLTLVPARHRGDRGGGQEGKGRSGFRFLCRRLLLGEKKERQEKEQEKKGRPGHQGLAGPVLVFASFLFCHFKTLSFPCNDLMKDAFLLP